MKNNSDLSDSMVAMPDGEIKRLPLDFFNQHGIDPRSCQFVIERGTASVNPHAQRVLKIWGKVARS